MNYSKVKEFWIKNIEEKQAKWGVPDKDFAIVEPSYKDRLKALNSFGEIDDLARKLRVEVYQKRRFMKAGLRTNDKISVKSEGELLSALLDDIKEMEDKLKSGDEEDGDLRIALDSYKGLVKDYEDKLREILGSDELKDWDTKIIKRDDSNKGVAELQDQVKNLTTEKNNLEKEVKSKTDQWNNHRCDEPDNQALNQLKDELKEANEQKERLQIELNKKDPDAPLEEEQENQNLDIEELRTKLNSKHQEIRNLQGQLAKKNNSQQSSQDHSKFFAGIAVGFSIVAVIGGMVYLIRAYKQKKKKNSKLDWKKIG